MYQPYVAFFWNGRNPAHAGRASDIIRTLRNSNRDIACRSLTSQAAIFDSSSPRWLGLIYVLPNKHGVIYGRLFSRANAHPVSPSAIASDDAFAGACVETQGGYLTKNYWGAYVAIITDPHSTQCTVIRDCSGQVPCYYAALGEITAVFSDIRHVDSVLPSPSINWKYLAAFLSSPHLEIRDTGLLGVSELLAGEALYFSEGRRTSGPAWSPMVMCMEDPIRDSTLACESLRETTHLCVSAWATGFHKILHSLSGGFDSSLILQLLAKVEPRPDTICINRYSNGPQEDERPYARIVARDCEVELLEIPMDMGVPRFDEQSLAVPRMPKPSVLHLVGSADAPAWNEICTSRRVQAIWTGQGGDHIFMAATRILGLIDCLRLFGLDQQLARALRDAVTLTRNSIWHVIAREASIAFSRQCFLDVATITPEVTHLCKEAVPDGLHEYTLHPWYLASRALPPGKRYQLLILSDVLNRHRPMPDLRTTEDFHPLLSQPIIETTLRIPLSFLLLDGRTRGLARQAFADILPQKISCREQKGEAGSYLLGLFRRSHDFISELLLDGLLVRQGILSRDALKRLLDPDFAVSLDQFDPLFACAAAEIWARTWKH